MTEASKIEWTDHTFNPWMGCTKVSPGCDNCYAEQRMDKRLHVVQWGHNAPRKRTSAANWRDPIKWNAAHDKFFAEHGRRQRVFCASLADVFDNEVDPQWRMDLFSLIAQTPNLDWQLLTKRIGNVIDMIDEVTEITHGDGWQSMWTQGVPPVNVWLGISVVNQEEADRDIPKLLAVPAAKRFLSMEPLLGPVDLQCIGWTESERGFLDATDGTTTYRAAPSSDRWSPNLPALDWVIVGGESGPSARPMHPDWARSLRDQCEAAGVPFLFKQWGEWLPGHHYTPELQERDSDLVQSRYPCAQFDGKSWDIGYRFSFEVKDDGALWRVGKKAAGRLLDGREWNEFPLEAA